MARKKRPNAVEEPPAASSSEDEEEVEDSDEEGGEDGSSSDDDGEEEPAKPPSHPRQQSQKQSAVKKPETAHANPRSKSFRSGDLESETEPESDTEATPKPLEETPKATKPRSKPSSSKRPNETTDTGKDSKKTKKKGSEVDLDEEEQKRPGEDTKKQLFQRLWSEEDEIAMLKGMIEYTAKKGLDPNQDTQAFFENIKNSLHVDCSKTQVMDKIRRLRKKYENNLGKGGKNGENRSYARHHDLIINKLSKKLWGTESTSGVIESAAKSNGKPKKKGKSLAASKAELIDNVEGDKMEVDNVEGNGIIKSANLKDTEKVGFDRSLGVAGLEEFVVGDGLDMIGGAKKAELEERWKALQVAQLELFLQRNELIKEQTELILDAMK